jgi:hypothetical protein
LIVGGILLLSGGSDTPNPPSNPPAGPSAGGPKAGGPGTPGGPTPPVASGPTAPASNPSDAPAATPAADGFANVTNLLPNETQAVYAFNMGPFRNSTLGGAMFRSSSGFRPEVFQESLGLPFERMNKFVRAESLKNKWSFNVIQMNSSFTVKADALKSKLGGQKGPKGTIKGFDYYLVTVNDVIDTLSAIDFTSLMAGTVKTSTASGTPLAWHVYDERTLIIADVGQMEQFLTAGRKPNPLSQYAGDSSSGMAGGPGMGMGMPPGGPGGKGMGPGMGSSGPPMPSPPGGERSGGPPGGPQGGPPLPPAIGAGGPPMPAPPGGPQGGPPLPPAIGAGGPGVGTPGMPPMGPGAPSGPGGNNANYTTKPNYLTIKPELKNLLDQMEEGKDPRQPFIFSGGAIDLESSSAKVTDSIRSATGLGASLPLPVIVSAGAGLHVLSESRLVAKGQLELKREDDARTLDTALRTVALPLVAKQLGSWLGGITIETGPKTDGNTPGAPGGPGMPMGPGVGGPRPAGGPPIGMGVPGGPPIGMGVPGGPPRGMGIPGGPPAGMGSGIGGPPPGMGIPGAPRGPGFPGMPNPGSSPGGTDTPKTNESQLISSSSGRIVYISLDVEVNSAADEKIRRTVENQVVRLRGETDVQARREPRWHELAATAVALKAQKLPLRGTYPIAGEGQTFGSATFVSRTPSQRVSFMVDLLPFLGKQDIFEQIDKKKPWRDDANLRAAANWIPAFINPKYPQESWHVRLPSLPDSDLGATHFVGLSGIGMDSAEYDLTNPALAKRAGLFNYNSETRLDDIRDGLSNTIYLIQVPPTYQRPWIAGGGATIMGVPEKNSVAPFVAKQANGKRGTYALMADGSVRWIADTIPDATFQALVTRDGGDVAGDLPAHSEIIPSAGGPAKSAAPKSTAAAPAAGPWKESVNAAGGYSVMLPPGGRSISAKQPLQLPDGSKIELNVNGVDLGDAGGYMVIHANLPSGGPQLTNEQRFEGAKQGLLANTPGGKFVKEEKIMLANKYEGRDFTVDVAGKGTMRIRVYLVESRLYELIAASGQGAASSDATKFFDSFKLTGK